MELLGRAGGGDEPLPRAAEIVRALHSILRSSAFAPSQRSREFLSFVVTEEIAGRGEGLNERTVGRRALGLDASFDGRHDSSVRVRATRVRAALATYYAGDGARDPVRIDLPRGSYTPVFALTGRDTAGAEGPLRPGVVVADVHASQDDQDRLTGVVLTEALVQRLLAFGGLTVVGPVTTQAEDPRDIAATFGMRFVARVSATTRAGTVRLGVALVDGSSGVTVWSTTSTTSTTQGEPTFDLEDRWAVEIAAQLADSAGVLQRLELTHPTPGRRSSTQAALAAFSMAQQLETPDSVKDALEALERAIEDGDRSPTVLALRAWVGAAAVHYGLVDEGELDRSQSLAQEAAAAVPGPALAQVALGMVAMVQHDHELAGRHGREAAARAPHHPTVLLAASHLVVAAGDWQHGEALAREAFRLSPDRPGHHRSLLALARLLDDDPAAALAEASLIHTPGLVWGHLYRALALSGLGHLEQARREMAHALDIEPSLLDDPLALFRAGMRTSATDEAVLAGYFEPFEPT